MCLDWPIPYYYSIRDFLKIWPLNSCSLVIRDFCFSCTLLKVCDWYHMLSLYCVNVTDLSVKVLSLPFLNNVYRDFNIHMIY